MLSSSQRNSLEAKLISTIISSESRFQAVYTSAHNLSHLFINRDLRELCIAITKYFEETKELPTFHLQLKKYGDFSNIWEQMNITITFDTNRDTEFILADDFVERETLKIQGEIKKRNLNGLDYLEALSSETHALMLSLDKNYKNCCTSNEDKINELLGEIKNTTNGNSLKYIKTGFSMIDEKTNGIPKGHLTIIGARPGQGKTDFMLQLIRNILGGGKKVGIISLEMTFAELQSRNISCLSKIDSRNIESGNINEKDFNLIMTEANKLKQDNYVIDDNSSQTPESIKANLRRWIMNGSADIVFIDYLTLIKTHYNSQRYDLEIGQLSQELREFAKETGLPIVLLSQLNRAVEGRKNKKPNLSDLRESGQIEQDSNLIMFLHWPTYYGIDPYKTDYKSMELIQSGKKVNGKDVLNIIIAKARNGQTGIVPLKYIPKFHEFNDLSIHKKRKNSIDEEFTF